MLVITQYVSQPLMLVKDKIPVLGLDIVERRSSWSLFQQLEWFRVIFQLDLSVMQGRGIRLSEPQRFMRILNVMWSLSSVVQSHLQNPPLGTWLYNSCASGKSERKPLLLPERNLGGWWLAAEARGQQWSSHDDLISIVRDSWSWVQWASVCHNNTTVGSPLISVPHHCVTIMANPFSNSGAPPAIPARGKAGLETEEEAQEPERTLMTKQACLIYKIPPQVRAHISHHSNPK